MQHTIKDDLHASWLDQLRREYLTICHSYHLNLKMPILTISSGRKLLGSWLNTHRILRISEDLILNYPWHVTIKVLKHEMGHQICAEILGNSNAGHGSVFRQACQMIGLDEAFSLESADSDQGLAQALGPASNQHGHQLIEKVRKLLALSHSNNEHEAALALQRASEILKRHRLSLDKLNEEEGFCHLTIDTRQQMVPGYRKSMCNLLQECFDVQVILSSLYDPVLLRSHKTVELLGRTEATAIAQHCWHFLENRLASLWQANKKRFHGNTLQAKNSYFLGVVTGFRESLQRSMAKTKPLAQNADHTSSTLPMRLNQQLSDFVALHYPRLRTSAVSTAKLNSCAYNEAVQTGRELKMRRPVDAEEAGPIQRFIPAAKKK